MKWQYNYSIGLKSVDDQHQKLVAHVDRLETVVSIGHNSKEIIETFFYLINYARDHFRDEEALMSRIAYPGMDDHISLHRDFVERVDEMLIKFRSRRQFDSKALYDYLEGWVLNHILVEDRKIADFIAANAIALD